MAAAGIVGDYKGSQAREAKITMEEWEQMRANMVQDEEDGMSTLTQRSISAVASSESTLTAIPRRPGLIISAVRSPSSNRSTRSNQKCS